MKYILYFFTLMAFKNTFSQNIIISNDTLMIKDQQLIKNNLSHIKIYSGDTLYMGSPTKKSLLTYVYKNIDKINAGSLVPLPLDDRNGWCIVVEKITEKDNRIKVKGKLRKYSINKKGKKVELGTETGVINDIEEALRSGEIIL